MRVWEKNRHKHLLSSKPTSDAVTPIVGSLLMLMILVVLSGAVATSFFNIGGERVSSQPLIAKISIESCEGGLPLASEGENATFEKNMIVLMHEGGNPLPLDTVSIQISGYGKSYRPAIEPGIKGYLTGNISLLYLDLSPEGKNPAYYPVNNKATLEDGSWTAGERVILCGQDSAVGAVKSSVEVNVDGDSDTSDNYGFKVGSQITLKVIDTKSNTLIAEQRAIIKHAD